MRLTGAEKRRSKWVIAIVFAGIIAAARSDGTIGQSFAEMPLRRMAPLASSQQETAASLARYSRDDPLGGGMTVLGTYYVEVEANGHKLRLQLVRRLQTSNVESNICRRCHLKMIRYLDIPAAGDPEAVSAKPNFRSNRPLFVH